jgi:hypothetical protein
MRKATIALVGLAVVGVLLYFSGGLIEGFVSGIEGHPGLPSCESSRSQSDAKKIFENGPAAKTYGIANLSVDDARKVLRLHQAEIARFVHAQMQKHFWQDTDVDYEIVVTRGLPCGSAVAIPSPALIKTWLTQLTESVG